MQVAQQLPPPPPPYPPSAQGATAQGEGASEWCKAAVMEGQSGPSYPPQPAYAQHYGQYDGYSSYTYAQGQQQQQQPPQPQQTPTETGAHNTAPPQLPTPPSAGLTPEQYAWQQQHWAHQYAWQQHQQQQQQQQYPGYGYQGYPNAYAQPGQAYQPQAAYQGYTQPGYYGYPGYPQAQVQPQQPVQPPAPSSKPASSLVDPRLAAMNGAAPTKPKSRFSAARESTAATNTASKPLSDDGMDIDDDYRSHRPNSKWSSAPTPGKDADDKGLKAWCERCFAMVNKRPRAEARLREALLSRIKNLSERGMLKRIDWDREPLMPIPPSPSPSPEPERLDRYSGRRRARSPYEDGDSDRGSPEDGEVEDSPRNRKGGWRGDDGNRAGKKAAKLTKRQKKAEAQQQQQQSLEFKVRNAIKRYDVDVEKAEARRNRFENSGWKSRKVGVQVAYVDDGEGFDPCKIKPIVGTCTDVEKEYFRLNEVPAAEAVRPEPVLREALELLVNRFIATPKGEAREQEYKSYLWTQFKAIRQDLLVQHLRNDLAVQVYETHARIALECRDLNEFNQCQTQLMEHYRDGLIGSAHEFHAYRLLYYVYLQSNPKYQDGDAGLIRSLGELTSEVSQL